MDGAVIGSWAGTAIIFFGLVLTWRRNGRRKSEERGAMTQKVVEFGKKIDKVIETHENLEKAINEQAVHCAEVTSTFRAEIANLKNKKRK